MQIALIGYGQMGQTIHKIAQTKGLSIQTIIDRKHPDAHFREINAISLKGIDLCIDFTHPESVLENLNKISAEGKNIVMGTTGWLTQIEEVKAIVAKNQIGFLYASNFSLGVNLFFQMVRQAAQIINQFEDYDIYSYEMHHHRKKDAPSGTALSLGEILLEEIQRKNRLILDRPKGVIDPQGIHLATLRGGEIPGTHCIGFDSVADTIELKHTARNRDGFALGSLLAAQWLNGKKGFFTAEDWLNTKKL